LSLRGDDISIFETTASDTARNNFKSDCNDKIPVPAPRILTPILHRTTFHGRHVSSDNMPSREQDSAFLIQLLISDMPRVPINTNDGTKNNNFNDKSVSINAELHDITFNFDPTSTFIPTITELLTPCTPQQMIANRKINQIQKINNKISPSIQKQNNAHNPNKKQASDQFLIIKLNVQIKQCLLDYISPIVQSHSLISVSLITISSTIVNNSKTFSIKFNMKNLAYHLSNRIFKNPVIEQNPLNINGVRLIHRITPFKVEENINNINNDIYNKKYTDMSLNSNLIENSPINQYKSMEKKRNVVLDLDRYLDVHCLVQLLTVDHIEAKLSLNLDAINDGNTSNVTDNEHDDTGKRCIRIDSDVKLSNDDLFSRKSGFKPEPEGPEPTIAGPPVSEPTISGPTISGPGLAGMITIESEFLNIFIYISIAHYKSFLLSHQFFLVLPFLFLLPLLCY
jgi:hypothetical protein